MREDEEGWDHTIEGMGKSLPCLFFFFFFCVSFGISVIREKWMTNHAVFVDKLRYHCPKVDFDALRWDAEAPSKDSRAKICINKQQAHLKIIKLRKNELFWVTRNKTPPA